MKSGFRIKFKNYKSFRDDFSTIESLKHINVFIGRNNSGKSSCIDIFQILTKMQSITRTEAEIRIGKEITDDDLESVFEFRNYGSNKQSQIDSLKELYLQKYIEFSLTKHISLYTFQMVPNDSFKKSNNWNRIGDNVSKSLNNTRFIRLDAERNMTPEVENEHISISPNGTGAVNVIHHVLNYARYDESLIHDKLLNALNKIMNPDSKYDGITIQKIDADKWEVFLYENDNRFPLSKMGSGLKTIILVLLNLLVIPLISIEHSTLGKNDEYNNIIFAFEELENNLHPALQRRLFEYLYHFSIENDTTILLTTHSHVAINMFSDKKEAQLYHVIKEKGKSSINKVEDYITKCEILQDLDVRASDLFQANGIIWVEGPSDKVYIKHWLELWGDSELVEGIDYQFLYYGGRILSHFTANPDSQDDNLINILSTNRNSAIVIDSDICGKRKGINVTKRRIKDEFKSVGMFCWITQGKEIENYIPYQAINAAYNSNLSKQCGRNELFPDYIKKVIGKSKFDKVNFAHKVIGSITADDTNNILDLKSKIIELSNMIKHWNSKE